MLVVEVERLLTLIGGSRLIIVEWSRNIMEGDPKFGSHASSLSQSPQVSILNKFAAIVLLSRFSSSVSCVRPYRVLPCRLKLQTG
jgi:hypothetical protein